MKINFIYILLLFLLLANLHEAQSAIEKTETNSNSYFPVNNNITLIYKSSFDDCTTRYSHSGQFTISSSESDDFKYKQTMIIKDNGVYVQETYQYIKIFLFINKEATYTYERPLLRFPLPLSAGLKWEWEGDEYSDGETKKVKVTGKALYKEFISTEAGRFEAMKLESIVEGSDNSNNKVTEWFAEGIGLVKAKIIIGGGGLMGIIRDILGYGTIEFELKEIRKK